MVNLTKLSIELIHIDQYNYKHRRNKLVERYPMYKAYQIVPLTSGFDTQLQKLSFHLLVKHLLVALGTMSCTLQFNTFHNYVCCGTCSGVGTVVAIVALAATLFSLNLQLSSLFVSAVSYAVTCHLKYTVVVKILLVKRPQHETNEH